MRIAQFFFSFFFFEFEYEIFGFMFDAGRSLKALLNKEVNDKNQSHDEDQQKVAKAVQDVHDQDQQEVTEIANELLTMDYTPARKKPPIHN